MRSTMRFAMAAAAVLGLTLAGTVAAVGTPAPSSKARVVVTLHGWSGTDPTPLTLVTRPSGAMTAAFTSTTDQGDAIWVADSSTGGAWAAAHEVADDIVPGSASVTIARSGAVVAAWDTPSPPNKVSAVVTVRSSPTASWTTPFTVATDDEGFSHQLSAGIDAKGDASVGYVHQTRAGSPAAFTRSEHAGTWSAPLEQSTGPVGQERLGVSANGTVTVAWTEDDHTGRGDLGYPTDLYVRRLTEPADAWQDAQDVMVQLPSTTANLSLLALSVSPGGLPALSVADRNMSDPGAGVSQFIVRVATSQSPCEPSCQWLVQGSAGPSEVADPTALAVEDINTTFYAMTSPYLNGQTAIGGAISAGDGFTGGFTATTSGQNSGPTIASLGTRFLVGWRSSSDGGVARVRGLWDGSGYDSSYLDPKTVTLGPSDYPPALAIVHYQDGYALWADTSGQQPVMQVTALGHTRSEDPEDEEFERQYHPSLDLPVGLVQVDGVRYDIRVKEAGIRHGFGKAKVWVRDVAVPPRYYKSAPGRTVCFSYRTRTALDGTSAWTPYECTTTAVDDSRLRAKHWPVRHDDQAYRHTLSVTRRHGATLVLRHVTMGSLALLVERREDSGAISVHFAGRSMSVIHLYGLERERSVVPMGGFVHPRTGTLRIRVVTHGMPVRIDGVFVSRR